MVELKNWETSLVIQKDPRLGCIPWGYEWLLRVSGVKGINFETFQDEFNLQARGEDENNFSTVANAIKKKYPHVQFIRKTFEPGHGYEKVQFIERLIERDISCLISLLVNYQYPKKYHIMPVVFINEDKLKLIWRVEENKQPKICDIEREKVILRHDNFPGGDDIAWYEEV